MSRLRIYEESKPERPIAATVDRRRIAEELGRVGVRFERWEAAAPLAPGAPQDEVIAAYRAEIDRLMAAGGYRAVDVVSLAAAPGVDTAAARRKFLDEHAHSEDEVRFFVAGQGQFTLHPEGRVYEVLCHAGDLLSVPAGTRHWFDMGPSPRFIAIRLFTDPSGWVAQFTDDDIAARFPRFDAHGISDVIVDIEGTVGSIAFARDVLFPYARARLGAFVSARAGEPEVRRWLDAAAVDAGLAPGAVQEIVAVLERWSDEDRKATPLKALQGMIWEEGYRSGEYRAHIYPEVAEKLREWKARNVDLYVYSSGSVQARKLFFAHTEAGDLTSLFTGYFDTEIGAKRDVASYRSILGVIGRPGKNVLFLSDIAEELDAAHAAGMRTILLARPPSVCPTGSAHPCVADFSAITPD